MRKFIVLGFLATALLCAGCAKKAQLQKDTSNPQVHQDEAQGEKIVQGCIAKGSWFTHSGRQVIVHCLAPPGQTPALERCVQKDIGKDGFLTLGQRKHLSQDLAMCAEAHR